MYYVEMTDTFGGELNYSWVEQFLVKAKTIKACMRKVSMETGYSSRKQGGMYKVIGANIGYSVKYVPEQERFRYFDDTLPVYVKCKQL